VTLEDVIFGVRDHPTRAGKSSVRRTVGDLAAAGLVEHEKGSHDMRLIPAACADLRSVRRPHPVEQQDRAVPEDGGMLPGAGSAAQRSANWLQG
jgi:hypothetical protein